MAHFYANIKGAHGEATRMGTKSSGISSHIRGWHIGARVELHVDANGDDVVSIYLTPGSSDNGHTKLIWSGTRKDYDKLVA